LNGKMFKYGRSTKGGGQSRKGVGIEENLGERKKWENKALEGENRESGILRKDGKKLLRKVMATSQKNKKGARKKREGKGERNFQNSREKGNSASRAREKKSAARKIGTSIAWEGLRVRK